MHAHADFDRSGGKRSRSNVDGRLPAHIGECDVRRVRSRILSWLVLRNRLNLSKLCTQRLGHSFSLLAGDLIFEATTVLVLRAHYTIDVFTGIVTALLVAIDATHSAPACDRTIETLASCLPGGTDHMRQRP